jgi:hypothetical protein
VSVLTAGLAVALEIRQNYRTVGLLKPGWMTVISSSAMEAVPDIVFILGSCAPPHLPKIGNKHIQLPEFAI